MVTESTYVFKLYLFQVTSNQLIVEPEGARLLTPRSTVLSGLELVDTSPKITPCESQSKRIETESLKTKTVVFTGFVRLIPLYSILFQQKHICSTVCVTGGSTARTEV